MTGPRKLWAPSAPQFFQGAVGVLLVLVYLHLMFHSPRWQELICPATFYREAPTVPIGLHDVPVTLNCSAVIQNDVDEVAKAEKYKTCQAKRRDETWYISASKSCDMFRYNRGYDKYPVSPEERDFPLAFSILTYEDVEQTERLLRAIYRPHNVYCIHADRNSGRHFRQALEAVAACLDHVFVLEDPVRVRWAEYPVLEAELRCLEALLARDKTWRYFINLTGREFPLRTNLELVRILKAYDGANDIDGSAHGRPLHWTKYAWRSESWQSGVVKPPPPEGFLICKGSSHVAASRDFANYAVHNNSARVLREWMRDIRAPDEHFFQSLNHNPQKSVPGSFSGDPDLKHFQTRFKIWQSNDEACSGQWHNFICLLGAGDLQRVTRSRKMFANKFRSDLDRLSFDCMEHWYLARALGDPAEDWDLEFYKQQPWVQNHVRLGQIKMS